MRKTSLLNLINIVLFILLNIGLILCFFINKSIFNQWWYTIVLFTISLMLIAKYLLFKSDNILWFALCLIGLGLYIIYYNKMGTLETWPILLVIPALASFVLVVGKHGIFHICLMILILSIALPLFLISFKVIEIWWFVLVEIASILLGIFLMNLVFNNYKG